MSNYDDNVSFFDPMPEAKSSSNKIDAVKLSFDGAESLEWRELFKGFNKIYAITFSSGINFVTELIDMFDYAEIIFGCEDIISYKYHEILAYQNGVIEKIRDTVGKSMNRLLDRIDEGSLELLVAYKKMSHEKIYILDANDGRKRVVMGSANMSYNAFSGAQRENICCLDGEAAFNWYVDVFNDLKETSVNDITVKAIQTADLVENIDELPISAAIKVKKAITIEPVTDDNVKFILDTNNAALKIAPNLPKEVKSNKKGKILLVPEHTVKLRKKQIDEATTEKEQRAEYPQLLVDVNNAKVTLNGVEQNLNPSTEEIKNDVDNFIKYMAGYDNFHGDKESLQYRYFEFANWFFCSPFMATMRDMAARYNQNRLPYPVFGLIYGQSKAGKTSFLETLLKMMIGQKPKMSAPDFTRSSIENIKRTVQGAPIIVDDLTNNRFNQHAIETIKNDDFGLSAHLTNYSAVVISANEDVKAVAPEVIRRTVICRVNAGLTNTEVMQSNVVRSVQQKIGTAFYREYLRRMLDIVPKLIDQLKDDESENAPDILKVSSEVIVAIISEHIDKVPEYIRELSLENYFSEQVTGKYAIKSVKKAWEINPKSFKIEKRHNEIRFDVGDNHEANRIMKELPETLEAHKSHTTIVMNLDEAKKFFDIDFKKSIFSKFNR